MRKNSDKKSIFKKNKRAKFNAKEYLKNNIVNKEGKAVIPIYLKEKEEMFNKHDPRGITLSTDVREYIDDLAYDIPYDYDIVFEVRCKHLTKEDKKAMEKVIKLYYGLEISGIDFDLGISVRRSRILYIAGTFFTILMFISYAYFEARFLELLFFILWYCLWEATDEKILTQADLKYDRMDAEQIYKGKVLFVEEELNVEN